MTWGNNVGNPRNFAALKFVRPQGGEVKNPRKFCVPRQFRDSGVFGDFSLRHPVVGRILGQRHFVDFSLPLLQEEIYHECIMYFVLSLLKPHANVKWAPPPLLRPAVLLRIPKRKKARFLFKAVFTEEK